MVKNNSGKSSETSLNERLAARGFRSTSQRQHVYGVLAGHRDHPTAEQVFMRAKKGMPEISMATVYNCLDTLVKSGLVREVPRSYMVPGKCRNCKPRLPCCCGLGKTTRLLS